MSMELKKWYIAEVNNNNKEIKANLLGSSEIVDQPCSVFNLHSTRIETSLTKFSQ